jgi:hypothetical protein
MTCEIDSECDSKGTVIYNEYFLKLLYNISLGIGEAPD